MKITVTLNKRSSAAMKAICLTRGVRANHLGSAIVNSSLVDCVEQGPGECIEPHIERAIHWKGLYDDWDLDAKVRLREIKRQAKVILNGRKARK